MKPLSPVDAIAPAFGRMRTILLPGPFGRFRFWFFVRIALVGALTSASFYSGSLAVALEGAAFVLLAAGVGAGMLHSGGVAGWPLHPTGASPGMAFLVAFGVFAALIAVGVWILLAWLWCRFRFTLFELAVDRHGRVGVAWSHYGSQAWRFLGITILAGLALLVLLAATAGPLLLRLFLVLRHLSAEQINADPSSVFAHTLPLYGILLPFGLLVALVDAVLEDFLLPPMALENAPVEQAMDRFFGLVRTRFGEVLVYFILRLVMIFGLTVFGSMVVFLLLFVVGGVGAGAGFFLYHALWHAGPGGIALFLLYCIAGATAVIAVYLLAMISLHGLIALFRQCFAVYFYGSHYPLLGDRLEPPAPPAMVIPPASQPPSAAGPPVPESPPVW